MPLSATSERTLVGGIFVLVYAIIMAGERSPRKLDRPSAALLGAVLMVATGALSREQAIASVDFATLALLFGLMIVVHYARRSGLLERLAHALVLRARNARQLLWLVVGAAGLLSALFVNDAVCLLMTPLVLVAARRAGMKAEPLLIALATSSNAGSMMTLTGNPQNMLIGQASTWSWGAFALRMVPIGLVCMLINGAIVAWIYRADLPAGRKLPAAPDTAPPLERRLAAKTVLVAAGLLAAFAVGAPMDVAAVAAAVVLIILANRPPAEAFAEVDWSLLLFFAGLFVVVGGVARTEASSAALMQSMVRRGAHSLAGLGGFASASVIGSNLFSNVPYVMLLRGLMPRADHAPLLWLAAAASATLAGNMTLVGSVANLIVAEGARAESPLSFRAFLRVGVVSTLVTVAFSVLALWWYACRGWA